MNKHYKSVKRICAWVLTLCMILTAVPPVYAQASEVAAVDTQEAVVETEAPYNINEGAEAVNVALNKNVTVHMQDGSEAVINEYSNEKKTPDMAVDGNKTGDGTNGCEFGDQRDSETAKTSMYLQVDLEKLYNISNLNLWRYFQDGRTYDATVIAVSENADFSNPVIIYNSDLENVHNMGAGTDEKYAETNEGNTFTAAAGTLGQYVRVYGYGSSEGVTNDIVELEVIGAEYTEAAQFNVTIPSGDGYQIVPTAESNTSVVGGGSFAFQIVVDTENGYSFPTGVKANDQTLTSVDSIYTIESITEDQNITIEGVEKAKFTVTFPQTLTGASIEVQSTTDESGTLVAHGDSCNFKVVLDKDYNLSSPVVKIKGGDTLAADKDGIYSIANIKADIEVLVAGIEKNPAKKVVTEEYENNSAQDEKNKKIYLSDIEWKSATNSVGATGENPVPSKDTAHHNTGDNPTNITLLMDGTPKTFTKGIGTQSESTIIYDLAGKGYLSFEAIVGVDYAKLGEIPTDICDARFKVYLDGSTTAVFDSENMDPSMNAKTVSIPLTEESKELKLVVEKGTSNMPYCDWGNWADAHFKAAYPEAENLALGKTVSVKLTKDNTDTPTENNKPGNLAVDGDTALLSYCGFGNDSDKESRYLQVDLGDSYELSSINLFRYFQDGRTYNGTVVAISDSADFSTPEVVYNSDTENKHGFGAGSDATYAETASGKSFSVEEGKTGRYVRVYMTGSNKGNTNHIVEVQAMGYDFGPKPYEAKAFNNASVYLDMPTHYQDLDSNKNADGTLKHISGQVTHPDIQVLDKAWNGYKYWMIYTPNTMVTSQYENPYIVASNDGQTWVEPEGIKNPIEPEPPSKRFHNCDADLVYDSVNNRMLAYWNWADDNGQSEFNCEIRLRISYDGVTWGVPYDKDGNIATTADTVDRIETGDTAYIAAIREADRYGMLSPTFTYDSFRDLYVMWANNTGDVGYSNGQNNYVDMRWSKDGINWSEPQAVKKFLGKNESGQQLAPWHQDISYIDELNEYWAISQCFAGGSPDGSVLYLIKSKDGVNWEQVGVKPVLTPGETGSWDDFQIYRSTFYYDNPTSDPAGGTFRIWYSALQDKTAGKSVIGPDGITMIPVGSDDSRIWRIGYTENSYLEVMKALTQDSSYEEPAYVAGTKLNLTMDKMSITVGEESQITAVVAPKNTSDQIVKYTSQNPEIATVNPMGKVLGVSNGTATIIGETRTGLKSEILVTIGELIKGDIRYEISSDHPMYLENYYWSDDAAQKNGMDANKNYNDDKRIDSPVMLYNTVPESLKDNTVILLIAERSLNNTDAIKAWIKENVELCNDNKVPCAVQIANGETNSSTTIPLSFWNELAKDNEYLVGFNAAEMYNRFAGDNRDYVIDVIRVGISHGVSMMWTDTNIFGTDGVLYDWLTKDDKLSNVMRTYKEYISLMTKESYGSEAANTDALFKGLWLTDYCASWGIASDWWHWQIDGNGQLFEGSSGDPWKECLTWPENMYTQDIVLAVSQGATCFKSEAQWYSNATKGMRTPTYQYSLIPFLEKLVSKQIKIPTKAEMLERTKAIVVGKRNWNNFNYDNNYSNLYPKTGQYGIVPYVPSTCPDEALNGFDTVINDNLGTNGLKAKLDTVYPVQKSTGTAYCETFGDTWYWMNSSEDKNVNQYTEFTTAVNGSDNVKIEGEPHVFGIIKEQPDSLNVYLSNYRVDKTELWDGTIPGGLNDMECYSYVWQMCQRMLDGTGLDTQLRNTVITIKNAVEPKVKMVTASPADRSYSEDNYIRPYTYKVEQKEGSKDEWVITVSHNGVVEFNIETGDKSVEAASVALSADKVDVIRNRTASVSATVLPANAGNKQLTWSVSDDKIATVNNKGTITGIKEGKTTLRAAVSDKVYAECEITVIDLKVTDVNVSKKELTLNAGDSEQVSATSVPEDNSDSSITWSSTNEAVATVSANGTITALAAGTAQIVAQSAYEAKGIVTVTVDYATSVKMDRTGMTATANSAHNGSNEGPAGNVLDGDLNTHWHTGYGGEPSVPPHWIKVELAGTKSINKFAYTPRPGASNGTILKYVLYIIDPSGAEKEVARGTWARDAAIKYVEFDEVQATAVKLQVDGTDSAASVGGFGSCAEINIYESATVPTAAELAANIKDIAPIGEADTKVTLPLIKGYEITIIESSDPEVITLEGIVTRGKTAKEVTLTLSIKDAEGKTANAAVKVTVPGNKAVEVLPESVTIDKTSAELEIGKTVTLNATVAPSNADNKTITWASDNTGIAAVKDGVVTAVSAGTAKITVTTVNGKKAECIITVKKAPVPVIVPVSVKLNKTSAKLAIGAAATLTATVAPSNAANKTITWKSEKTSVATVSNGVVKAINAGTTKITASTVNGKTAVCTITVSAKDLRKMKFAPTKFRTYTGKALSAQVIVKDGAVTLKKDKNYTVSYKNNVNPGTATITIKGIGNYTGTVTKTFVIRAAKGKQFSAGRYNYVVTDASITNGTVRLSSPKKTTYTSVYVPTKVKIGMYTYKVTAIGKNAFKNNKKLTTITMASNIKTIESGAFYGASRLKNVTFKGTKLKNIGSKAFTKTHSKITIKVPKSKLSTYKKLLNGKGLSSKATIS